MSSITTSIQNNSGTQAQELEKQQGSDAVQIPNRRKLQKSASKAAEKAPSAFRTISEVADEIGVQQHVLRFWESKFSYIKPLKRGGGRRYYRPDDVELLKNIHHLLYTEGYTIKGVQKLLQKTRGNLSGAIELSAADMAEVLENNSVSEAETPNPKAFDKNREKLKTMLDELKSMRDMIN